jgi:hypothetical protein
VVLVHRKPEVQQLQLSVVPVEQISSGRAVLARTPHVLPQPVQRRTLLRVPFGIIAVGLADMRLERSDPIDLVGLLQRAGDHRRELQHLDGLAGEKPARENGTAVSEIGMSPARVAGV